MNFVSSRLRYLTLIPVVAIIINIFYFKFVINRMQSLMFHHDDGGSSLIIILPEWVFLGHAINMFVVLILQIALIVMLCKLGHIWQNRSGSKWRDKLT